MTVTLRVNVIVQILLVLCWLIGKVDQLFYYLAGGLDGARRHALNTGRMDSGRDGYVCWDFINGFCRFGAQCNYRHELPVAPSAIICRHFQKGGCWYGERCRFLHVPRQSAAGRRSSVPVFSSSTVGHAPAERRGSEPALQAELVSRQEISSSRSVVNVSEPRHNTGRMAAAIEGQTQGNEFHLAASGESSQSSETAQAGASNVRNGQETSAETTENGAAAATSDTLGNKEETEAFLRSKNVTCGICMDKVYEKTDPSKHIFGILPNCNHSFCLQCIKTWRKTRDLGQDVVKSCPQCRVKSAFYVPNKYWVEGKAKESVVAAFRKKFSKKSCIYYSRYRRCPFKADCLYRHDKPAHGSSFLPPSEEDDYADEDYDGFDLLNLVLAMTLLSGEDDDDDLDIPLYLTEEYGF